jgi:hypothetical protein
VVARVAAAARPPRALVAYHEAGHAAIGHGQGLRFSVIYLGDASGQVLFDEQWDPEEVVRDAALLDRYGLMLLAGAYAEQRYADRVLGAQEDVATLRRMTREARQRGTEPRSDLWRRAEQQVDEHWPAIEALADELVRRSRPAGDPAEVLAAYPHLGRTVDQTTGRRARWILERFEGEPAGARSLGSRQPAARRMSECS